MNCEAATTALARALSIVAGTYGYDEDELLQSADPRSVRARQVLYWVSHEELGCSYAEAGRFFGRHHTTVMAGTHHVRRALDADPALNRELGAIAAKLRQRGDGRPEAEAVEVRPDDVVVVSGLSPARAGEVEQWFREHLPTVKVLVLEACASVAVVRAPATPT